MRLRFLRGTPFDPFGYGAERQTERKLICDYETTLSEVLEKLNADNHHLAVGIAAIPEKIRGFGHVQDAASGRRQGRRGNAPGSAALRPPRTISRAAEVDAAAA